jgi:MFS family permease
MRLRADTTPLRESRPFRALFGSRTITLAGSQATAVALLVQAEDLTGSALAVGLLGVAELIPLIVASLYGGLLADRLDRRAIARATEAGLAVLSALLAVNAALPDPMTWPLYAGAAAIMGLTALQRPSLDAAVPRVVDKNQLTAASALMGLGGNAAFIAGSALGGILAAGPGVVYAYGTDAASFAISLLLLLGLPPLPTGAAEQTGSLRQGAKYALGRQELVGSYAVDLVAMVFAFPVALFPFVAADLDATWALGPMFAAPAIGAFIAAATSGWANRVTRHGVAIAIAAIVYGGAIAAFGIAGSIALALAALVIAGAADMISGIFRETLWNQTIPDELRGRLAGFEVISYGLGPPLGQLRAGGVASATSASGALWSGGALCIAGVVIICAALPRFRGYDSQPPG